MRQRGSSVIRVKVKATTGRAELIGFTEWVTHHRRGDGKTYWENQAVLRVNQSEADREVHQHLEYPSLLFITTVTNLQIWTLLAQSHSEPYFTEQMWQFMAFMDSQIIWDPDVAPSSRNFFASVEGGHDIQWEACPTHQRLSANQRLTREKNSYMTVHPAFQKFLEAYKVE